MAHPYIPLDVTTGQQINYVPLGKKYQYQPGQYTSYYRLNNREVPKESYSVSQYIFNLKELENFLLERAGHKPFMWAYNQRVYICTEYNIDYVMNNKGNISMIWEQFSTP